MRSFFDRLYGNEQTKSRIGSAIMNGTLPHAFLIGGDEGSGKTTLSLELAAALNCERRGDESSPLPCGECNCCKRIYDGNFPDLKILSKQKDRATIGVDAIKDFREDMFLSSTESDYKFYVIDDAECMTTEAQNALLKVLEEPPSSVVIVILAKECDKILTTIKSRAQYIAMSRFDEVELERYLLLSSPEAREIKAQDKEKFRVILMSSDGRLGLAKKLSDRRLAAECAAERDDVISIIKCITTKQSYAQIHSAISLLPTKRSELLISLEKIISALRDLIIVKQSDTARPIFFTSREEAEKVLGSVGVKKLLSAYDELCRVHGLCSKNANVSNLLVMLTAKIKLL